MIPSEKSVRTLSSARFDRLNALGEANEKLRLPYVFRSIPTTCTRSPKLRSSGRDWWPGLCLLGFQSVSVDINLTPRFSFCEYAYFTPRDKTKIVSWNELEGEFKSPEETSHCNDASIQYCEAQSKCIIFIFRIEGKLCTKIIVHLLPWPFECLIPKAMTSNIKSRYFGTRLIPLNALFFEQRGKRRLEKLQLQYKKDLNELISFWREVTEMM